MAAISDTITKLKNLRNNLNKNRERNLLLIVNDMKAAVRLRIQNLGLDDQNQPLQRYSDVGAPAYLAFNKDRPNGAKIGDAYKDLEDRFGPYVSHKDIREFYGLPIDKTTLTFTGQMWRDTTVQTVSVSDTRATVVIKGKNQEAQNKIDWNSARYGNILEPTDEEVSLLRSAALERVVAEIRKVGL